jgi:hypothetical protein
MDIAAFLERLESSSLGTGIRDSLYLFPFIESLHVVGLATLFGMIAILDLRLLGLASARRPVPRVMADVMTWAWLAFMLTAATGALMFITNAGGYFENWYFRAKMLMLALAGINVLVFELTTGRALRRGDGDGGAFGAGRAAAVLSLVLWVSIIFAGRWIGFTTSKVDVPADPGINFDDLFAPPPGEGEPPK